MLALSGTTSPALAKGPTDVVVSGPGIDDVHLTYTVRDDLDSGTFGEASRLYDMWDPGRLGPAPDLSAAELGPRYVLTWSGDPHSGLATEDLVIQNAYPFAEGGAWVEFPPGQELWGAPIASGWEQAPRLQDALVELGAADDAIAPAVAEVEPVSATARPSSSEADAGTSYDVAVPAGIALAVVLGAGAVIVWRRLSR